MPLRLTLLVPALATAAVVLAACDGGEDQCCDDLPSYFERIDEIDDKRRDDFVEFNRELDATFGTSTGLNEANRGALVAAYARGEEILDDIVELLQQILPPPEAAELHDEMIDGHRDFRQSFATLKNRVPTIRTAADLVSALEGQADAGARATRACQALQQLADDNGIEVTLDCGIIVP